MDAPYHGVSCARIEFGFELQTEGASTMDITTIGFDLAKTVFQVHGADAKGRPVLRRKLRRGKVLAFFAELPSCLVGMEACRVVKKLGRALGASLVWSESTPTRQVVPGSSDLLRPIEGRANS